MGVVVRIPIPGGLGAKGEELEFHSKGLLCARPGLDPAGTCSPSWVPQSRAGASTERSRGHGGQEARGECAPTLAFIKLLRSKSRFCDIFSVTRAKSLYLFEPWLPPLQMPPGKILSELREIAHSFIHSLFFEHLLCARH